MRRALSPAGLDHIKRWESFRARAYPDVAGIPTIGYGTIRYPDGRAVTLADPPITEERAAQLLAGHVAALAAPAVLRNITVPLNDGMYDMLVSFAYNCGGGALRASTLRAACNREDHFEAARQFNRWVFAGGRRVCGLVNRRRDESRRYLQSFLRG